MLLSDDADEAGLGVAVRRRSTASKELRIAMLAPPWIPVPPPGYGGIESVVSLLADEMVNRGHAVTLFAAPGSRSRAELCSPLSRAVPEHIGETLFEADHVGRAFAAIDAAENADRAFDIVHDHCGFTAIAMADRLKTPMVHTFHGAFTKDTFAFYAAHGHRAATVASRRRSRSRTRR
jgi:glycosyltransferase involved in cell wall biosynthesis